MKGAQRRLLAWSLGIPLISSISLLASACDKPESTRLDEVPPPHVRVEKVAEVTPRPKSRHLVLLQPARRARLSPRMGGQVIDLLVEDQQKVSAGDVLCKLAAGDSKGGLMTAKASISRIQEQLLDTERDLQTTEDLVSRGVETTRAVERLQTQRATLQAQLREAKGTLLRAKDAVGASTLDAPFSGTVTSVDTELGEYIGPGSVAMVLAQLDPLAVEVPLTEAELAMHDQGHDQGGLQFALVVRGERIEPRLEWIANEADPGTSTFTARLLVDNAQGTLRAGESARVEVFGPQRGPVLAVPMTAVRWSAGAAYVLRMSGDAIERVDVRVGDDSDELVTVEGPLAIGDPVVAAGPISLMPGDHVVVVEAPPQVLAEASG
ncbi:efflux RND transporter periplasmic adaptor subunit [Paraliomyxa miuraensis]|uniref:efflux RND transporter periplasmic adaptor subunit n=1 Tax=Paraliomyxa miuraensis TaxID=376150 RepID=UPI0022526750|nr:efflux RND transporter periplasmic adaptor subunit [Paraliomyxa miuraensis]MCX4239831.1 efflux RND transporter periplasmic adaptor subunit [Paraliomyxa miuraensis]